MINLNYRWGQGSDWCKIILFGCTWPCVFPFCKSPKLCSGCFLPVRLKTYIMWEFCYWEHIFGQILRIPLCSHCPEYLFWTVNIHHSVSSDEGVRLWGCPSPDMSEVQSFFTSLLYISLFAPSSQVKFHMLNNNLSSSGYIQHLSAAGSLGVVHKSKLCRAPGEMKMLSVFVNLIMLYFILKGFYKMFIPQVYFQPVGNAVHVPCTLWVEGVDYQIWF